jgi:hypothetical protein
MHIEYVAIGKHRQYACAVPTPHTTHQLPFCTHCTRKSTSTVPPPRQHPTRQYKSCPATIAMHARVHESHIFKKNWVVRTQYAPCANNSPSHTLRVVTMSPSSTISHPHSALRPPGGVWRPRINTLSLQQVYTLSGSEKTWMALIQRKPPTSSAPSPVVAHGHMNEGTSHQVHPVPHHRTLLPHRTHACTDA